MGAVWPLDWQESRIHGGEDKWLGSGYVAPCAWDQDVWTSFEDTRKQLCCLRRGVVARGAGGVCGWEVGGQGEVSGRLDQARAAG